AAGAVLLRGLGPDPGHPRGRLRRLRPHPARGFAWDAGATEGGAELRRPSRGRPSGLGCCGGTARVGGPSWLGGLRDASSRGPTTLQPFFFRETAEMRRNLITLLVLIFCVSCGTLSGLIPVKGCVGAFGLAGAGEQPVPGQADPAAEDKQVV